MDAWNINVSAGVISLAVSFSRWPRIQSGPVALCGFKLVKSFMTLEIYSLKFYFTSQLWCEILHLNSPYFSMKMCEFYNIYWLLKNKYDM